MAATLGQRNPFRYRGYYFDPETGLYYLKTRYYDPETCRFISADLCLSTGQGVLGYNGFTYCLNDPVGRADGFGTTAAPIWEWFLGLCSSSNSNTSSEAPPPQTVVFETVEDPEVVEFFVISSSAISALDYCCDKANVTLYKQMKCSNLVSNAYASAFIGLSRVLAACEWEYVNSNSTWSVFYDQNKLIPGDLVFYCDPSCTCGKRKDEIHHISIFAGNDMMFHSTVSKLYGVNGVSYCPLSSRVVNDTTGIDFYIFGFARYIGE